MAINKKLIHFKTKENFMSANGVNGDTTNPSAGSETDGNAEYGQIKGDSIVFIKDSKEIWTHGNLYKSVNWSELWIPESFDYTIDYELDTDSSLVDVVINFPNIKILNTSWPNLTEFYLFGSSGNTALVDDFGIDDASCDEHNHYFSIWYDSGSSDLDSPGLTAEISIKTKSGWHTMTVTLEL